MSGDSLEYLEYRLQDLAEMIARKATRYEHKAFAKHLKKCSEAAIMLAKVLDDDCSPGDELLAIRSVVAPADVLNQAIQDAHAAEENLRGELEKACGRVPDAAWTLRLT